MLQKKGDPYGTGQNVESEMPDIDHEVDPGKLSKLSILTFGLMLLEGRSATV